MEFELLALGYESYSNYIKLPHSLFVKFNQPSDDYNFIQEDSDEGIHLSKEYIPKIKPPYYFSIESNNNITSYCGVMDFTADDDIVLIPNIILEELCIDGSDIVKIKYLSDIPKGDIIQIEPLDKDIFEIPDLDKFLEKVLSKYCLLYQNQIVQFLYNSKKYKISINYVKTLSNLEVQLVDIVNTDIKIDIVNKFLNDDEPPEEELDDLRTACMKFINKDYKQSIGKKVGGLEINNKNLEKELRKNKYLELQKEFNKNIIL